MTDNTGFTEEQNTMLRAKLNPKVVKKHPYSGCDYIEGWHAIAEANRIFGHGGWGRETVYNEEVCRYEYEIRDKGTGWKVGYEAKVCITVNGVIRYGTGHGSGTAKDLFDCIEGAAKEAETDAMKRALMTFGNAFGLALYDKEKKEVGEPTTPEREWLKGAVKKLNGFKSRKEVMDWNLSKETVNNVSKLNEKQKDHMLGVLQKCLAKFDTQQTNGKEDQHADQ